MKVLISFNKYITPLLYLVALAALVYGLVLLLKNLKDLFKELNIVRHKAKPSFIGLEQIQNKLNQIDDNTRESVPFFFNTFIVFSILSGLFKKNKSSSYYIKRISKIKR